MGSFTTTKVAGQQVTADEWNQLAELNNAITSGGLSPSTGSLDQLAKAMGAYSGQSGVYAIDSGSANSYTLSIVSPFKAPPALTQGLSVKFRAGNANTGASTVVAFGLTSKSIKLEDGLTDPSPGDISTTRDSTITYDGTVWRLSNLFPATLTGKNVIINGSFQVWQRNTTFSSIADAAYFADRFKYHKSGAMVHDASRSTDVPSLADAGRLFNYSGLIDCTTVDSSIASGDHCYIEQIVEGYNWLPLAQKTITLSFWVKATKTGTYCISLRNNRSGTPDRSYVAEYSISTTDTWEKKTITISASPSAGTWDYTNGAGIGVAFVLAAGSTYQTTAGAWQTGNYLATSNQVNACDDTANNFRVTAVQLEVGSSATEFEQRQIGTEFLLCQRYYEKSYPYGTYAGASSADTGRVTSVGISGANRIFGSVFQVNKRANPTITLYTNAGTSGKIRNYIGASEVAATASEASNRNFNIDVSGSTTPFDFHFVAVSEL